MSNHDGGAVWQPVNASGHLAERIVTQVQELIRSERLKPGDRLPSERELAGLLNVSRPVLREALRILVANGQLSVRHGRGVFIERPIAEQDLRAALAAEQVGLQELFAMREVLELAAAVWAAENAQPEDVSELADTLGRLDEAAAEDNPDFAALQQLDSAFHRKIVETARNRFLRQTVGVLQEMMHASMHTTLAVPGRLATSKRDHHAVLDAIGRGDSDGAKEAMRAHLAGAWAAAQSRLERDTAVREDEATDAR